jgi:hypothetical protein
LSGATNRAIGMPDYEERYGDAEEKQRGESDENAKC